jgi:ubiquitin C-terminal hydrolase
MSPEEDISSSETVEPIAMEDDSQNLPYGGLKNLGNTCYLNSALQMLASLDVFTEQIRKHVPIMDYHENEDEGQTLREALLNVLERLAQGETLSPSAFKTKVDQRSPLFAGYRQQDAHEFLTTLLDLLDEDYKKKPQSEQDEEMKDAQVDNGDEQMSDVTSSPVKKQRLDESQEVALPQFDLPSVPSSQSFKELEFDDIENLLHGDGATPSMTSTRTGKEDGLKCKLVGGRMHATNSALTRWDEDTNVPESSDNVKMSTDDRIQADVDSEPFSPVDAYFTTQVRVCLTCDSCLYRRTHTETYLHLSLEIGSAISSIDEGLRAFFKPEKREVKCEKCFCETASQTTEIIKLPRALLLHLKRFIVDVSPDYLSISYSKDQSAVSLEQQLDLNEQSGALSEVLAPDVDALPPKHHYTLRSVVNHIGSSASCGHYTADALRMDHNGQREWIRFNDSFVSRITEEEAMDHASTTAYMVLYELESS